MRTVLTGRPEHCNIIIFITKHKAEQYDNINNYRYSSANVLVILRILKTRIRLRDGRE